MKRRTLLQSIAAIAALLPLDRVRVFAQAGVKALPPRPAGQHVVADLMAFYFRSSEANDHAYSALINREVCRPIAITTKRPRPLE